jgi:hypothetical protein
VWQFVIRQEGGRCIEFSVSAANGWFFVTKLDDVFRNLGFEVEVSCSSDILICLVVLLSRTTDSNLVRQLDHVRFLSNPSQLTLYPTPFRGTLCNLAPPFDTSPYRRQVEARRVRPEVQQTFENPNLPVTCSWMQFWFATAAVTITLIYIRIISAV